MVSFVGKFKSKTFVESKNEKIIQIPLSQIKEDPNQPRKDFDEKKIEELAQSIKHLGKVQNPILVKSIGTEEKPEYMIITGERRFRASKHKESGQTHIRAIVTEGLTKEQIQIAQLVENIQREDLNVFETACGLKKIKESGKTQSEIAKSTGMNDQEVSRYLTILKKIPEKWLSQLEKHCPKAPLSRLLEIARSERKHQKRKCENLIAEYIKKEKELELEEEKEPEKVKNKNKKESIIVKKGEKEYDANLVWESLKYVSKNKEEIVKIISPKALDKILEIYESRNQKKSLKKT